MEADVRIVKTKTQSEIINAIEKVLEVMDRHIDDDPGIYKDCAEHRRMAYAVARDIALGYE